MGDLVWQHHRAQGHGFISHCQAGRMMTEGFTY